MIADSNPIPQSGANKLTRILFFGSQMETGGAQRILLEQALWFHEHGYNVTTAFLYDKEGLHHAWEDKYPFPIFNLKARQNGASKLKNVINLVSGMISAYRFLRGNHFDIIETFTHHPNMIILPLAWLAGIRVRIATHHGMFHGFGKTLIWLHASIINSRMVNSIVAVSEYVREQAECEGINSEKISVILNGVRVPIIDKKFAREKIRARLGINDKDPILLTVGRLQVEKGHDLLLQAAPLILDAEPRALFIFAGDGLLRNQLEMKATALGIANHIMFLGFRNDVPDLMAASDILLMPSRTEGMPNALLEAMSLGLPVVGFDVGGIGEAALNGKTSILVPPLGWQELASSVINLINDPEKCRQFGLASIQRINSEFTMDGMCMGYENIFGKIMKQI